MFVAKFDPPVIVPYSIAVQIYTRAGAQIDMHTATTFDGLMFPHGPKEMFEAGEARTIKQRVEVPIFSKDGKKTTQIHKNTLWMEKIDYGRVLTELPFGHPSQLVDILPVLRQYAFISTLIGKSFKTPSKPVPEEKKKNSMKNKKDNFSDFMKGVNMEEEPTMDVSFTTQPSPRIKLVFPFKPKGAKIAKTAHIRFDIKQNGIVEVKDQNILDDTAMEDGKSLTKEDLGRMLEITEDIGIWMEFVRRRLG